MTRRGWHPEDLKAAIRKTGITLSKLSLDKGFSESTVRQAILFTFCPAGERVIAEHLQIHPHELWPDRYDEDGTRIIGNARSKGTQIIIAGHCQKEAAA